MSVKPEEEVRYRVGSRNWWKRANELALSYAPRIRSCRQCKQPQLTGFVCMWCGCPHEGNEL